MYSSMFRYIEPQPEIVDGQTFCNEIMFWIMGYKTSMKSFFGVERIMTKYV